jgi:membrane protease YdiL (CAAX protease family)
LNEVAMQSTSTATAGTGAPARRTAGSTLVFFALAFAVSWGCWIPLAKSSVPHPSPFASALAFGGAMVPALVALALTWRAEGAAGLRSILVRVLRWDMGARWYAFALAYMAAIKLTVALLHRLLTGSWPQFGATPLYVILFVIATSTPFQAGEEIGWRGYALPRLAARWGFGPASIGLGVVWALWHLPIFFIGGADKQGQSLVVYVLQVTALSVAVAFLYARTRGSLLLPMIMHAAVNNSKDIVPSASPGANDVFTLHASLVAWLTVALVWMGAAVMLATMPQFRPEHAPCWPKVPEAPPRR